MARVRRGGPLPGRYARLGIGALAIGFGAGSLAIARHSPVGSFAGNSVRDGIIELAVGWSLALAGLAFWARRAGNHFGPVLAAAGIAWFLPEWSNPDVGISPAFTLGLVAFVSCTPLVAHAALSYPQGRIRSGLERAVLVAGYTATLGLLGLLPASVFDPAAEGCLDCPANLFLVHADSGAVAAFTRWGLRAGFACTIALALLIAWRLARSSAPTVAVPVLAPAAAYLGLVAWDLQHSMRQNVLGNDPFDVRLWRLEAGALGALALGIGWGIYRSRQARTLVARLVVDLTRFAEPGHARETLARALGDAGLELAYRRTGSADYIDPHGRPVRLEPAAGYAVTPLERDGRPVAALVHEAALLADPDLIEEVVGAARLEIENERFHAEVKAQLESLRASRARIVESGDRERQRLERDLHDGAQQRLVGLSLALRMLRTLSPSPTAELQSRLDQADAELQATLADLRDLAHGIFPAVLADDGLAAALKTLADTSPTTIDLRSVPDARLDPAIETTAYFVIAETLRRTRTARATVAAARQNGSLVVELEGEAGYADWPIDLEDRVGALDGTLTIEHGDGGLRLRVELPCA
jgi:signal transduction histidine kinase